MITYFLAFAVSVVLSIVIGLLCIPVLKKLKAGQSILSYVKEHEYKSGTPTMGGIIFVLSSVITSLVFCSKTNLRTVAVILAAGGSFGAVGFLDDYIKIKLKHNEGLKPYQKIIFQFAVAGVISVFACINGFTYLVFPFVNVAYDIGWWMLPLGIFIFIATTNCVNLTDGLDGLAAGVSYVYFAVIAVIIVVCNGIIQINNIAVTCVCLSGALLGFLSFNTFRAKVFMGDTGSLAIGGFISSVNIFSGNAHLIPVLGIIFVIKGISVIMQVIYFKKTGKRIFLMAPIHHHFQMKGVSESKIAFVYKLITLLVGIVCIIGFC